ncbi:SDR family oxidoreductase [Xanthovirga aplysinae]|uniref:SDR family oxidoreductase n=1 Tax=Xanthovirga aplysinae TaxID=2529853 RepID=UPI0012BCB35F|nr:SDR family oxidoreductase [Xanthovirga aplysinae]MTI30681.1 SDR family oxidoreductase [Xanthovirga aplysinae]
MSKRKIVESKVLVTGGAGFIGSNLIERLLSQDNTVVCLDNFSTGKEENIKDFLEHPNFILQKGDIRNLEDCKLAVRGVSYILHQAALGSVPRSINDPITSNEVNVSGFLNMLLAAKEEGVKRFVYAASSSTYGDHPGLPKIEDKIGKPLSPYAITKYVNELYARNFSELYGLETIGLRYFNVFGRRQDPNGAYAAVIPKFVRSFLEGKSPTVNGDGTHSRDFTYVENVIQANQLAALTESKEAINTVYNVACGENTSLNELVEAIKEYLGLFDESVKNIHVNYGPERKADVKHSLASIEKAKELLGYQPTHSFQEGLNESIDWYRKYLV